MRMPGSFQISVCTRTRTRAKSDCTKTALLHYFDVIARGPQNLFGNAKVSWRIEPIIRFAGDSRGNTTNHEYSHEKTKAPG